MKQHASEERLLYIIRKSWIEKTAVSLPYLAWKCGGGCSLWYIAIIIPKNLLISGRYYSSSNLWTHHIEFVQIFYNWLSVFLLTYKIGCCMERKFHADSYSDLRVSSNELQTFYEWQIMIGAGSRKRTEHRGRFSFRRSINEISAASPDSEAGYKRWAKKKFCPPYLAFLAV